VRSSSAGTASAWKLPRYASNWSCSNLNGCSLTYAILIELSWPPFVAGVGECPDHRKARYRDCLASCRVSPVLAMAIAA
jgi:hypothetical protein